MDGDGVPEELRCKRSDGKQWRCSAPSMPDKTVCERHYIQAKKRAASSALSPPLPKSPRPPLASSRNPRFHIDDVDDDRKHPAPRPDRSEELSMSLSPSSTSSPDAEGLACHQCRRDDRARVLWCSNCDRRGYCDSCVARWYVDISMEDIRRACPACRGICSCAVCRRGQSLIKARIREISSLDKLKYLHGLLSFMLPTLKKMHMEQCFEAELENKLYGIKSVLPRARINSDEQMCCDICGIPIVDYHRHCTNCLMDVCLDCCREVRRSTYKGESRDRHTKHKLLDTSSTLLNAESSGRLDAINLTFQHLFPRWKAKSDGSIRCPGDSCSSPLTLQRIFKINWVSKLAKHVEEMVNGCRVSGLGISEKCIYCSLSTSSSSREFSRSNFRKCSKRQGSDNFLYTPTASDIRRERISHFRKHWASGEPIIVRHAIEYLSTLSWDPRTIWIGINETANERHTGDDGMIVKALDFSTRSEVEIELDDFIRGYSERSVLGDGMLKMLKLKAWPSSGALEEFLLCQRPEVLKELPLLEFIHSKWGLLNLAAKLPRDIVQIDGRPHLYIAYGTQEELGEGDSVTELNVNISDTVYVLMHSAKSDIHTQSQAFDRVSESNVSSRSHNLPMDEYAGFKDGNASADDYYIERGDAGSIWDVFRRQDVPKLNEYLKMQPLEFWGSNVPLNQVTYPLYDRAFFLHKDQKQKVKEELGIEPWTFEQHVGEAVFIPAGCAYQQRNLKSSVHLAFDFLSPESLSESMLVAQEIRHLPKDHAAKLQTLEVGKMPLYASSWAIREIQKMVLDPKIGAELGFEDHSLTEAVSDNLQKFSKRSRIPCR